MLKPAQLYKEELEKLFLRTWYDLKYMFYSGWTGSELPTIPDDLIDRKTLKEEVESFRITITGMRNGKTITAWALREYKKSILRIIDEQPCHGEGINIPTDDGWIPVEERLPGEGQKVLVWYEYCR